MRGIGQLTQVGVEGTGAYGMDLARYLTAEGIEMTEVNRPNRRVRRRRGKSDPIDAEAAARAVWPVRRPQRRRTAPASSKRSGYAL
jgi:transposase